MILKKGVLIGNIPTLKGYSSLTTHFKGGEQFVGTLGEKETLYTEWTITKVISCDGPGKSRIQITNGNDTHTLTSYCKVTHILDPVRYMQGAYRNEKKGERRISEKMMDINNQAYVDAIACITLSRARELGLSPHFCLCYGVYRGIAERYQWNITQEFETYRNYKKFWEKKREGIFTLHVDRDDDEDEDIELTDEYREYVCSTPSSDDMHSRTFSYTTADSRSSTRSEKESHISLTEIPNDTFEESGALDELESLEISTIGSQEKFQLRKKEKRGDESTDYEEDTETPLIKVMSEMKDFPVMIIFQEHQEGTLEELIWEDDDSDYKTEDDSDYEDSEEDDDDSEESTESYVSGNSATSLSKEDENASIDPEREARWAAWIFQIVAACCQMQGALDMMHNDLHTENIVWSNTEEEFLWYRANDGRVWRVPTYGKLFRIIDFGRSTYTVDGKHCMSSDFAPGGDAEGQYNYGNCYKESRGPILTPNPSFDLCRLSISLIECLYPVNPPVAEFGLCMSKEGDWEVRETVSPLFNLLWRWLLKENGENVLRYKDGTEKYPGFELYKEIAWHVHGAKPSDALQEAIFSEFLSSEKEAKDCKATVYRLYQ